MSSTATGTSPPTPPPRSSSKTARAASAFKSGVVYGGSALLNGVNAITPHFSGAVDVMVVEQPDGSYKSTPFYVRFGKYTHLRSKDRIVSIYVNGQLAPFHMHLGEYGQAYFTSADLTPEDDDDDEQQSMLAGMMSPPSGYSSGDEDSRPQYANAAILASVQEEVQRLQDEALAEQAQQQQLESSSSAALMADVTLDPTSYRAGSAPPDLDSHKSVTKGSSHGTGPSSTASSPRGSIKGSRNKVGLPPSTLGLDRSYDGHVGITRGSSPAAAQLANENPISRLSQPEVPAHVQGIPAANPVNDHMADNKTLPSVQHASQLEDTFLSEAMQGNQYHYPKQQQRHPTSLLSLSLQNNHLGNDGETFSALPQPVNETFDDSSPNTQVTTLNVVSDSSPTMLPVTVGTDNFLETSGGKPETNTMPTSPFSPQRQETEQSTTVQQDGLQEAPTDKDIAETGGNVHQGFETDELPQSKPTPILLPQTDPLQSTQASGSAGDVQQQTDGLAYQQNVVSDNKDGSDQGHMPHLLRTAEQGVQGLDLSMCGAYLHPGMPYSEAVRLFEAHKVSPVTWVDKASELLSSPHLIVRLQGDMCPWIQAAPMVMGWAVFGAWWPHLLPVDTPRWSPPTGFTPQSSFNAAHMPNMPSTDDAKKTSSSSWRLWPFSSNRKPLSSSPPVSSGALLGNQLPPRPPINNINNSSSSPKAGVKTKNGFVVNGDVLQNHPTDAARQETLVNDSSFSSASSLTAVSAPPQLGVSGSLLVHTRSSIGPNAREPPINLEGVALTSSSMRDLRRSKTSISRKTLSPSKDQLAGLRLKAGQNIIKYTVGGRAELTAYIYFFHWTTRLVISDVDGTITKSDVLGHLLPAMGWDWSHAGISRLFTDIERNKYQLMYLSSRSISQAGITREYLNTLVQGHHRMPVGPVIISPHGLLPSLYREMILRRPHEFKIATLQDIRALFPPEWNPFYAGFGNRDTDEISYRTVGVPMGRIFIINPKGELRKAAVEVQTSSLSSLAAINELVHDIFPPTILQPPLSAVPPPPTSPVVPALTSLDEVATTSADVSTTTLQRTTTAPAVVTTTGSGTLALSPAGSGTLDVSSSDNAGQLETRSVPVVQPTPSSNENTSHQSQKDLLHALQALRASETYNDLAYWNNDPSAYMAGDLEALEKLVVHVTPARPSTSATSNGTGMSDANGRDLTSNSARREGLKASDSSPGALQGMGSTISDVSELSEDPPLPRRSRDFIATYNPFAY